MHRASIAALLLGLTIASTACASDGSSTTVAGVGVPDGFAVELVADGFSGPTQFALAGDGRLIVAELNGAEGAGSGRVLGVDRVDPSAREVLVDHLLTPTGVAVDGDRLWIMEQRRLTVGPLADPTDRTVVLDDLAFNGRSEGTLTPVPGGGILYDTSGTRDGDTLVAGSGTLWFLAGPDARPEPFATGFKHAYAHTTAGDGRWFVTEISDGQLDGGSPPDELMIVARDDDFGYPKCIGDRKPVVAFGVTQATCDATPHSLALFAPQATPTAVAVAPWDPASVVVALWNAGSIVTVPATPGDVPQTPQRFIEGITHPQHLLADGSRLLVGDFDGGRILAVKTTGDG